jgi:hypothetical protein
MNSNIDYQQKYLKYKKKYIALRNQLGGGIEIKYYDNNSTKNDIEQMLQLYNQNIDKLCIAPEATNRNFDSSSVPILINTVIANIKKDKKYTIIFLQDTQKGILYGFAILERKLDDKNHNEILLLCNNSTENNNFKTLMQTSIGYYLLDIIFEYYIKYSSKSKIIWLRPANEKLYMYYNGYKPPTYKMPDRTYIFYDLTTPENKNTIEYKNEYKNLVGMKARFASGRVMN